MSSTLRNLPAEDWTQKGVRKMFESCGALVTVSLLKKGKASLRFKSSAAAAAAAARDCEVRGGRTVRIKLTTQLCETDEAGTRGASRSPNQDGNEKARVAPIAWRVAAAADASVGEGAQRLKGSDKSSHARRGGPRERAAIADLQSGKKEASA